MSEPAVFWTILFAVILFASGVGFLIARASGPGATDLENGEIPRWWPHKWQRLFWMATPFILTLGVIGAGNARGWETGPLWGLFCALFIIQAVVGGMFGFSFDLVSSIVCGVFISVEVFILGAVVLFGIFDFSGFIAIYLVLGILGISAGAVLAAWWGSLPNRRCDD